MASATATSVFISRIRSLPVLDGAGDQVGKVRDVVVQRRADGRAPRVKGLVVELFARHRIFIPMARVRSIDAVQVVISGVVNTRRFERRESETLVIDDLFDLTVERLDHPAPSVIFDVVDAAGPVARVGALRGGAPGSRHRASASAAGAT